MADKFEEVLADQRELQVGNRKVVLDPEKLAFNEANLTRYIEQEGIWYNNFSNLMADAEAELSMAELNHEAAFNKKFATIKEQGGSDKFVEAMVKGDPEIVALKSLIIGLKRNVKLIQGHLRAWDKNHDNSQSRGHMLRKEMDKLGADIFANTRSYASSTDLDKQIEDVIEQSQGENEHHE